MARRIEFPIATGTKLARRRNKSRRAMSDKTHVEHNESALTLIADIARDMDFRCNGPLAELELARRIVRTPAPTQCTEAASSAVGLPSVPFGSLADVGADDVTEPLPSFALEPCQLQLREGSKRRGGRVDLDTRQKAAQFEVFYAGGLLHHILSREIIAAGNQHMLKSLSHRVGVDNGCVGSVRLGIVLVQESVQFLHDWIVLPLRISWVFHVVGRDDPLRSLKSRRLHHRSYRNRDIVENMERLPA